ncbi:uncharacterized protein LOC131025845 [Salvia miltiorrhiza]|uniref:uncharacterized protein LOC131025845 n=1 Tax=Salvia miltiorrhiza TaxID=226208 RepID=UPI0025AD4232|nr:uncharacterized protein LOC131025845 [Salvia miltiorrhiza]
MNVLVWNVRGISNESKRVLTEHCRTFAPVIVGIIEPKSDFHKTSTRFWRSLNLVPCFQNSRVNMRSNIWVFSHPSMVTYIIFSSGQVIIMNCIWSSHSFKVAVVHGDNDYTNRRQLWIDLLTHLTGNAIMMGDFNAVKGAHERSSDCLPNATACTEFSDFIDASGFIEAPSIGLRFTWSGRRFMPSHVESILDRALFSEDFAALWQNIYSQILPRNTSDHSPLILHCSIDAPRRNKFFRFLDMWTLHPDFLQTVENSWELEMDIACPIYKVMAKLKRLRQELRNWNKSTFGNVDTMLMNTQQELLDIQMQIASDGYTEYLFDKEVAAQARINTALCRKNSLLQQKSRISWLKDGDRNTNFFHAMLKYRKKPHIISHLEVNGEQVFDQTQIGNHIVDYFSTLFNADHHGLEDIVAVEAVIDNSVSDLQNNLLVRLPDEEKITAAVFAMDSNSSPGPDGFSGKFYQSCWQIIKSDIWEAVQTFFRHSYLPQGCNSNTLVLIPKKDVVCSVADLRPIVLSNFLFKIVSKLHGYFACSRGVRQGDPLSPILFGIAEDVLSTLFSNCVNSGHLVPMSWSRRKSFTTHLLYADDILVFCKATINNAHTLWKILDFYGSVSGQIVSQEKSHIFFTDKVPSSTKRSIEGILRFEPGRFPFNYLGVPIFQGRARASHLRAIHDKILNKFARWKGLHLSMAGRLCLIQSVIQSSLTHSMMIYKWPHSLLDDLDTCCRNFLWTGNIKKTASCPVSWARVCAPKHEGGLGLRSFKLLNKCFLMKRAWKLIQGRDFGFDIIRDRYLDRFCGKKEWIAPSSIWLGLKGEIDDLVGNTYTHIGDGLTTSFWHDEWLGYSLASRCNIPPFMAPFCQQSVADYFHNGVWHFTQAFINNFPEVVCDILLLPLGEEKDVRFWKPSLHGNVTAALAFKNHCSRFPSVSWGTWLWENFIPVRRSLVCWRVLHNRMPTCDRLIRQGMSTPNFCPIYYEAAETLDHLFWSYNRVRDVWISFLDWFHYQQGLDAIGIHNFLAEAWNYKLSSLTTSFWKAGIITLLWAVWMQRNRCIHDNQRFEASRILHTIKVAFNDMDNNFQKLGHMDNNWKDYLILRHIGVRSRPSPPPDFVNIYWSTPSPPWIKVNTDGSAAGAPGLIAAGGVFHDNWNVVRGFFHYKGGVGFAFEAELLAIISAIQIAHARGWLDLWIEVDSIYVVNLLQKRSSDVPWRFAAAWKSILKCLSSFRLKVTHIFREGNAAADIMANQHRVEGWWPHEIDEISIAVRKDMASHNHVRIVR